MIMWRRCKCLCGYEIGGDSDGTGYMVYFILRFWEIDQISDGSLISIDVLDHCILSILITHSDIAAIAMTRFKHGISSNYLDL